MSFSTDLRDACADAAKQILTTLGETVTYSHRGAATVSVKCAVGDLAKSIAVEMGIDVENTEAVFTIPKQTSFPPTNGISVGDEIVFNSITYDVVDFKNDSPGAIFSLQCERKQARTVR